MKNYVVAIGIEKVQNFIYYSLTSHQQESQSNDGKLKEVLNASNFISDTMPSDIKKAFCIEQNDFLINCSGKWIFELKEEKETISGKLEELFANYYKKFQGQLILKYTYFEQEIETDKDKLKAVQMASKKLKESACFSNVLSSENIRKLVFNFYQGELEEENDLKKTTRMRTSQDKRSEKEDAKYPHYVETINELLPREPVNGVEQNENRFRIAVIKADFDGMGAMFKGIKHYELYKKASDLLKDLISFNNLHDVTDKLKEADTNIDIKLYPLYIAGDDIFFAVPVHQLLKGIQICTNILIELNKGIDEINTKYTSQLPHLSLSIGVELTFNREPIRYYYERVNRQLDDYAKKVTLKNPFSSKQTVRHLKISLNETVFIYILEGDENKQVWSKNRNLRNWSRFVQDIGNLNDAIKKLKDGNSKNDDYQAHHFYYSLLEKINDPKINANDLIYSNAVLYHLLPQTWGIRSVKNSRLQKQQEAEFTLIEPLIRQLLVEDKEGSKEQKLSFSKLEKERLQSYLRMLVLFSDPRFFLKDVPMTERKQKNVTNNGKGILVNKTLKYLYQNSLKQGELRKIFVCSETYKPEGYTKKGQPTIYRTLEIKNAMFHRIKKVMGDSSENVCKMIAAANPDSFADVKGKEKANREEGKAPPRLFFNEDDLRVAMNDSTLWNRDYVDALLIFYQYKERAIQFQTNIKPKKARSKAYTPAKKSSSKHSNNNKTTTTKNLTSKNSSFKKVKRNIDYGETDFQRQLKALQSQLELD